MPWRRTALGGLLAAATVAIAWRASGTAASLAVVALVAVLAVATATRFFPPRTAVPAALLTLGGAFSLWYPRGGPGALVPLVLGASIVWLWSAVRATRSKPGWIALGLLVAATAALQWQSLALLLLPLADLLIAPAPGQRHPGVKPSTKKPETTPWLVVGSAALPLLVGWYWAGALRGMPVLPTPASLADALFAPSVGLFAPSPVLYLAALGTLGLAWRRPRDGWPLLAAFTGVVLCQAAVADGLGDPGAADRWNPIVPLLVPGMALVLESLTGLVVRRPWVPVGAVLSVLVLWNLTLMSAAHRGVVRLGESVSFRGVSADQARTLHGWFGHAPSYPANLWFALWSRRPPADYDVLWDGRFLATRHSRPGAIDVGASDDGPFLVSGWHGRERALGTSFRWASRRAAIVLPLDHPEPLELRLRIQSFSHAHAPPQQLTLETGTLRLPAVTVPTTWDTVALVTPKHAWRAGLNEVTLRFQWADRPSDVGMGGDSRELAAAVDFIDVVSREATR
jgi:hypothetical protein